MGETALPPSDDTISGIVDSIIYQNEDNGYTVCEIEDTAGNPVTLCGIIPYLAEGDRITARGSWVTHQTYGRQFKVESFEKDLPAGEGDVLRYLASGAVKGIGPKTAQKIVELFGTDSFDVISNHPDWLAEVPGLTPKKAAAISADAKEQQDAILAQQALDSFNLAGHRRNGTGVQARRGELEADVARETQEATQSRAQLQSTLATLAATLKGLNADLKKVEREVDAATKRQNANNDEAPAA